MASTPVRFASRAPRRVATLALAAVALGAAVLVFFPASSAAGARAQQVVTGTTLGLPAGLVIWVATGLAVVFGVVVSSRLRAKRFRIPARAPEVDVSDAAVVAPSVGKAQVLTLVPSATDAALEPVATQTTDLAHCA